MKINRYIVAAVSLVILFGGILIAKAAGYWQTTNVQGGNRKNAVHADSNGGAAGSYSPDEIRGSYTFSQIADTYQIDSKELLRAFGFSENLNPAAIKVKDLETKLGDAPQEISNHSMKMFVGLFKNLPTKLNDGGWLLKPAAELIRERNKNLTAEQDAWLTAHTLDWLPAK